MFCFQSVVDISLFNAYGRVEKKKPTASAEQLAVRHVLKGVAEVAGITARVDLSRFMQEAQHRPIGLQARFHLGEQLRSKRLLRLEAIR